MLMHILNSEATKKHYSTHTHTHTPTHYTNTNTNTRLKKRCTRPQMSEPGAFK